MFGVLYRFVLCLVHAAVLLDSYLQTCHAYIRHWYRWLHRHHKIKLNDIRKDSELLTKRPHHIALLLNDGGDLVCSTLADVIAWSIGLNITYITVYEKSGHICDRRSEIYDAVSCKMGELFGEAVSGLQLKVSDCAQPYHNGIVFPKQVCVQLLSEKDCRNDIINVCQSLQSEPPNDISSTSVNARMTVMKNLPDPDLAFQFGDVPSLMGFSPWHTHLTEIVSYRSHREFSYFHLMDGLLRFSRCQQRYGK